MFRRVRMLVVVFLFSLLLLFDSSSLLMSFIYDHLFLFSFAFIAILFKNLFCHWLYSASRFQFVCFYYMVWVFFQNKLFNLVFLRSLRSLRSLRAWKPESLRVWESWDRSDVAGTPRNYEEHKILEQILEQIEIKFRTK